MYGDQFGEFVCGYWGLKGLWYVKRKSVTKFLPWLRSCAFGHPMKRLQYQKGVTYLVRTLIRTATGTFTPIYLYVLNMGIPSPPPPPPPLLLD